MDSAYWYDTLNFGWSIIYQGSKRYNLQIKILFPSLKIFLIQANSVDHDEMLHYA